MKRFLICICVFFAEHREILWITFFVINIVNFFSKPISFFLIMVFKVDFFVANIIFFSHWNDFFFASKWFFFSFPNDFFSSKRIFIHQICSLHRSLTSLFQNGLFCCKKSFSPLQMDGFSNRHEIEIMFIAIFIVANILQSIYRMFFFISFQDFQ